MVDSKYLEIFHLVEGEATVRGIVADLLPFKIICGGYPKSPMGIESS